MKILQLFKLDDIHSVFSSWLWHFFDLGFIFSWYLCSVCSLDNLARSNEWLLQEFCLRSFSSTVHLCFQDDAKWTHRQLKPFTSMFTFNSTLQFPITIHPPLLTGKSAGFGKHGCFGLNLKFCFLRVCKSVPFSCSEHKLLQLLAFLFSSNETSPNLISSLFNPQILFWQSKDNVNQVVIIFFDRPGSQNSYFYMWPSAAHIVSMNLTLLGNKVSSWVRPIIDHHLCQQNTFTEMQCNTFWHYSSPHH